MKLKIAVVVGCALLLVGASSAAAKPKGPPPVLAFQGTAVGASTSVYLQCAWDAGSNTWPGIVNAGWSFLDVRAQSTATVDSKALGKGTIAYSANVFSGGGSWVFSSSKGKGSLYGGGNVNLGSPSFPYVALVQGGTGTFANVKGGQLIIDRPPFTPPPPCSGVDNALNGTWDPANPWPQGTPRVDATSSIAVNGWLYGFLTY